MFTLWGPQRRFCDRVSRRDFLRAGALGLGGLTLADLLRLRAQQGERSTARSVIMICLAGGPSHIDMYDLKPNAPADVRGDFKPIKTNVPGFDICELFPRQAAIADKLALVRTVQFVEPMQHELQEVYTSISITPTTMRLRILAILGRLIDRSCSAARASRTSAYRKASALRCCPTVANCPWLSTR